VELAVPSSAAVAYAVAPSAVFAAGGAAPSAASVLRQPDSVPLWHAPNSASAASFGVPALASGTSYPAAAGTFDRP
jgi:hypothetical protein